MKSSALCLLTIAASLTATSMTSTAAIVVPGANGTDGVLNITDNTEIDLSEAVAGTWDQNNTANAGKGVYDASKWAVVFKYTSVTVAAGKTVTFKNHASRAPVVWLVSGSVTIDGTVSLDGDAGFDGSLAQNVGKLAEAGPGGFRGGAGFSNIGAGVQGGPGFGVGGGNKALALGGSHGSGGNYGGAGGNPGYPVLGSYGNPSLVPLIGGSGGAGSAYYPGGGGGGGGILIACQSSISLSGTIRANGGASGPPNQNHAGGGSGGGIRVVTDSLSGAGGIQTLGGVSSAYSGGVGRIRIERVSTSGSPAIVPDPSVIPLSAGATVQIWPPSGAPEVRIISLGGAAAPMDPRASFGSAGADVALPAATSTEAVIETTNVEQAAQVQVRVAPRTQGGASSVNAVVSSIVSLSPLVIRWVATLPVQTGYSAVQVKVIRP